MHDKGIGPQKTQFRRDENYGDSLDLCFSRAWDHGEMGVDGISSCFVALFSILNFDGTFRKGFYSMEMFTEVIL